MEAFINLFEDLRSPDPSVRLSVLWKIERIEWNADRVLVLRQQIAAEADLGVRFHLQKILARVEGGLRPEQSPRGRLAEIESALQAAPRDDLTLALLLDTVTPEEAPLIGMALREARWPEFSQEVIPFVLQFFRKFGSYEDVAPIEDFCRHPNPRILSAAIEALEKLQPDSLQSLIVPLLSSPSHGIRIRAIKILFGWDQTEAVRHFETMLFSTDPAERQAALINSIYLPFAAISGHLLNFIAKESDPALLRNPGMLLQMNPSPDLLLPITDLMESSRGEKRALIADILSGLIRALSTSGILQKSPEEILADLKQEYRRRQSAKAPSPAAPATPAPGKKSPYSVDAIRRLRQPKAAGKAEDPVPGLCDDFECADLRGRLALLARIETIKWTRERVETLEARVQCSPEGEGRDLLARVHRRVACPDALPGELFAELPALLAAPAGHEFSTGLLLGGLSSQQAGNLLPRLRDFSWSACPPELLPILLRFLKKHGHREFLPPIGDLCRHPDPRVVTAAIEALETIHPAGLKDHLLPLFLHPLPVVRSRAVLLLHRWEPHLALQHFEAMLFSGDRREREASLMYAFFFPFAEIEFLLLRFLTIEDAPDLLEKLGMVLRTNPSLELAERVLENRESCRGDKKLVLSRFLEGIVHDLSTSGLVKSPPRQILEDLESGFRQRQVDQTLLRCEVDLQSREPDHRRQAVLRLSELARTGVAQARELLRAQTLLEKDPEVRRHLDEGLGLPIEPVQTGAGPTTAGQAFPKLEALNADQRLQLLRTLPATQWPLLRPQLGAFLPKAAGEEKAAVMHLLDQHGDKSDAALLYDLLKESDPEILAGAIAALQRLDPDYLFPYLPRLIQHPSDPVRFAALKVFLLFDKKQTLVLLEKMLFSPMPHQRFQAISCAGQLDFLSVKPLLIKALTTENQGENLRQVVLLWQGVADEAACLELMRVRKGLGEDRRRTVEDVIRTVAANLVLKKRVPQRNPDELIAHLQKRLDAEPATATSVSEFAVDRIRHLREKNRPAATGPTTVSSGFSGYSLAVVILLLIAVAGVFFRTRLWEFRSPPLPAPPPLPVNANFDAAARTLSGTITAVEPDHLGVYVITPEEKGVEYHVSFDTPPVPPLRKGQDFQGRIQPLKKVIRTIRCQSVK